MRSKFNFNAFSERARPAIYTSRKDFHVYRFYRGRKSGQRWHIGAPKNEKFEFFGKYLNKVLISFSGKKFTKKTQLFESSLFDENEKNIAPLVQYF